jgi:integrase
VRALLYSIDRSTVQGLRDFSLLYLAAAYGLRSSELVHLTLDDLDWRERVLGGCPHWYRKPSAAGRRLALPSQRPDFCRSRFPITLAS